MIKKIQRKLGLAAMVAAVILGAGWSLTTQSGSEFLANGSAILVRSWGEVFGAGGASAQVAITGNGAGGATGAALTPPSDASGSVAAATPKATVKACWSTEQQDLANLAGLLQNSNASLADLAAKLAPAAGACPASASSNQQGAPGSSAMLDSAALDSVALNDSAALVPLVANSTAKNIIPAECPLPESALSSDSMGSVILNEIAWMGSVPGPGQSTTKAGNQEWIELKNVSADTVALNGWQVVDSGGSIHIVFGAGDSIPAGGLYLLSRSGNAINGVAADKSYSGALSNSGDVLAVFDADCGASDFLDASTNAGGWPAGNNKTKQTMERRADVSGASGVSDVAAWQTSGAPGGTPRAENSSGLAKYTVSVALQGDGLGAVVSAPAGISCNSVALTASGGSSCSAQFTAGTALTLTATPGKNTVFVGWSGGCSGSSKCVLTINGTVSANATFHAGLSDAQSESLAEVADATDVAGSVDANPAMASTPPPSSVAPAPAGHLVIAQIQIAGASSANDFVKIYNPTASAVDISGWKLHKKSSTGTDASLRVFPSGASIGAGAYFVWANSAGGFAQSMGADASSTETLSADNSVALFDASGALVDAVAWGTGANQYVEGSAYPTNPAANRVLARRSDGGGLVDSDNNAQDFSLP